MAKDIRNKSTVTDWIQAITASIGTIAAIVGLILAWFSLTKSDTELQLQINKLDTVATQSIEHTKLLSKQVELLKEDLEFQKEQNELSLSQRKTDIEPKLIIEFKEYNGGIVSASLLNNGKSAKILNFKEMASNDFIIHIPFQYIGEGKEKEITFHYKNPNIRSERTVLNFTITYEDIDRKVHSKDFRFTDIEGIINKKYNNEIIRN